MHLDRTNIGGRIVGVGNHDVRTLPHIFEHPRNAEQMIIYRT